jgi:putative ATP-binding cassette transporter
MQPQQVNILDRELWSSFWKIARPYWSSEDKIRARALLVALAFLLIGTTALSVTISYAVRDLMTALSEKDIEAFKNSLWLCLGVFVIATPVSTLFDYTRRLLSTFWREWLTKAFLAEYFSNRAYFNISHESEIDNPDQRISQDVASFTSTSLDFLTEILASMIQLIVFIGVLWSISSLLVLILVGYAAIGTIVVVVFGKKLINLNFLQLKREADLRYGLVHVRNNVESIAFFGGEDQEKQNIQSRLHQAIQNFRNLITWQKNLAYFTFGYQYLIQVLPIAIMAPLYFSDEIKFGVVTQAGGVFATVLAALTLIVTKIESLSQFAAGITRLATFKTALQNASRSSLQAGTPQSVTSSQALDSGKTLPSSPNTDSSTHISFIETPTLALHQVTIYTPKRERVLMLNATVEISKGSSMIILGPSGSGKSSILRVFSGLWRTGEGVVSRPPLSDIFFLPQRPYMILGTLRDQLLYPFTTRDIKDHQLESVLETVNLPNLIERVGGLGVTLPWAEMLSLGEQQRLSFARLLLSKPHYAMLDESTSALDEKNEARLYGLLREAGTTYISVGHRPSLLQYHATSLELDGTGLWTHQHLS